MKKRRVISRTNLPMRLPVWQAVTLVLVLDRVGAPGWLWGVAGTMTVLALVAIYAAARREEQVDVLAVGQTVYTAAAPFVTTESTLEHGAVRDVTAGGHA